MTIISFDRAVDYYDETRGFLPGVAEQIRDVILSHTGAAKTTRFLELGIGTGRIALPFLEAGYDYDGVDISIPMMAKLDEKLSQLAARRNTPHGTARCLLLQADVTHPLPLKSASYDILIAVHVFHLIQNWQALVRESHRVLKQKGWLLISTDDWAARDHAPEKHPSDADTEVNEQWNAILHDLGFNRNAARPFNRASDDDLRAFLETLGARTEIVELLEYARPAITARQAAARITGRMYSSDWYLPDEIHAQAAQRLDQWINTVCTNPDASSQGQVSFCVLAASWGR